MIVVIKRLPPLGFQGTLLEWRTTFWITFGVMMATNLVYVLTAQASVQSWDRQPDDDQPSKPAANTA